MIWFHEQIKIHNVLVFLWCKKACHLGYAYLVGFFIAFDKGSKSKDNFVSFASKHICWVVPGMSCIRRALQNASCASLCNGMLPKSALWRFVTVFGADSLSETERCIAIRQNKMAEADVVSARFKCFFVVVVVLG